MKEGNSNFRLIRILVLFSFLPFYIGSAFFVSDSIATLVTCFDIVIGSVSFIILIIKKYRNLFSRITFLILIMYLYLLVITIINRADTIGLIRQIVPMLYIATLFSMFRDNIDDVFVPLQWFLGVLIIINVSSLIVYPNGMGTVIVPEGGYSILYFLRHDNSHIIYLLPCFVISEYRVINNFEKRLSITLVSRIFQIFIISNIIITHVGNTIVWLLVFIVAYNVLKVRAINKTGTILLFVAVPITLNIVVVLLQKQIQIISIFAQNVLGKNTTFTGRIYVWTTSINLILDKPLTGRGYYGNSLMPKLIGYQQAHNLLLQLALIGGVVIIIIYAYILKQLYTRSQYASNLNSALCSATLISYLIYAVAESQFNYKMLIFIPILWFVVSDNEIEHHKRIKFSFARKP